MIHIPIIPRFKKFSNYPFVAISTIPIFAHDASAQSTQFDTYHNDTTSEQNDRLDTPDNIVEFHTVVTFTITLIILSWCGCFYVFYRTYKQWLLDKKKLKMIHRLPFYTAFSGKQYIFDVFLRSLRYLRSLRLLHPLRPLSPFFLWNELIETKNFLFPFLLILGPATKFNCRFPNKYNLLCKYCKYIMNI